jgi:alkylated DNA nucleotide flippase Atl1
MDSHPDPIVDIAPQQVRFFGGPGKMVLPSPATLEALIKQIPKGKLLTTDLLRKQLAAQFNVQGACPVTTRKALQVIAHKASTTTPYWRLLKQNGELINYFPGGVQGHAKLLKAEGFAIDAAGKAPKVQNFKVSLIT